MLSYIYWRLFFCFILFFNGPLQVILVLLEGTLTNWAQSVYTFAQIKIQCPKPLMTMGQFSDPEITKAPRRAGFQKGTLGRNMA